MIQVWKDKGYKFGLTIFSYPFNADIKFDCIVLRTDVACI